MHTNQVLYSQAFTACEEPVIDSKAFCAYKLSCSIFTNVPRIKNKFAIYGFEIGIVCTFERNLLF